MKDSHPKTAYFVAPVVAKNKYGDNYRNISESIKKNGYKVYDDVNNISLQEIKSISDNEISKYMTLVEKRIRNCDIFVAEISYPSISIGYEIGYAVAKSKPILLLRVRDLENESLGAPLRGNGSKLMNIFHYESSDLDKQIKKFLRKVEKGIFVKRLPIEFTSDQVNYVQNLQLESGKSFNSTVREIIQNRLEGHSD